MLAQHKFPRLALVLILLIGWCAGLFAPPVESVEAKPAGASAFDVIINEIAWGGTSASTADEWIELYNNTGADIDLSGWTLISSDLSPSINLTGIIPAGGYYLLEQTDDNTVFDITADQIYSGTLSNTGETLTLTDNLSNVIDTANIDGGSWDAGSGSPNFYSMERIGVVPDSSSAWQANNGIIRNGLDADGNPTINGTPGQQNSAFVSYTPLMILINEIAWMGTIASSDDEWVELHNPGTSAIDLTGWRLIADDGSPDITLSGTIPAGGYYVLERGSDNVVQSITADLIFSGALDDVDEILRLRAPNGTIVDTANSDGGTWHAGILSPAASMERVGAVVDGNLAWSTFQGIGASIDAGGNLINGTPGISNVMLNITPTFTPSITPSPTNTFTPSPTLTLTSTITPTSSPVRSVIINEIAWAGTASSLSNDEWIELYNTRSTSIDITGWRITAADGTPNIILSGIIPAGGYFLLEKDDDNTVSNISADQIYTGNTMSNSGEDLTLYDGSNKVIDTANGNGGSWPQGSSSTYGTMERITGTADSDSAWVTNTGVRRNGVNANGGNILGTPKNQNSPGPTPTPSKTSTATRTPTPFPIDARLIINEILPRPGFDWNQDGLTDVYDEFIEVKNLSPINVDMQGWRLDTGNGSVIFSLPEGTLQPNERIVFYSAETNLLLSDGGETVRLINPSGKIYDAYTYTVAKAEDESICRLPDGNVYGGWFDDCLPTPNLSNTREGNVPTSPDGNESAVCHLPDTIPADFFFAECGGYGANIWNPLYWDTLFKILIQNNTTKWESFIE